MLQAAGAGMLVSRQGFLAEQPSALRWVLGWLQQQGCSLPAALHAAAMRAESGARRSHCWRCTDAGGFPARRALQWDSLGVAVGLSGFFCTATSPPAHVRRCAGADLWCSKISLRTRVRVLENITQRFLGICIMRGKFRNSCPVASSS